MYRDKARYGQDGAIVRRAAPATFNAPLKKLKGPFVFTCSWSDFFIEEADDWREDAWDIIRKTPHLTYQILTKRPERILANLPYDWAEGWNNVWLGVSVESAKYQHRILMLEEVPAQIRFLSAEPLLGPLDLVSDLFHERIDWVITGGESGPGFRPAQESWFLDIAQQCRGYSIPFFHKQNGGTRRIDGVAGGRELAGRICHEMPRIIKGR